MLSGMRARGPVAVVIWIGLTTGCVAPVAPTAVPASPTIEPSLVATTSPASALRPRTVTIDVFPDPPQAGHLLVIAVGGMSPGERVSITVTPPGESIPEARVSVDRIARFSLLLSETAVSWDIAVTSGGVVIGSRTISVSATRASPLPSSPLATRSSAPLPPTTSPPLPPGVRVAFDPLPPGSTESHPDHALAVGPKSIAVVGNSQIAVTQKSGALVDSMSVLQFFDPVRLRGEGVSDPWMTFDPDSGRFFYVADGSVGNGHTTICAVGECVAHHLLAVSKSDDPRSLSTADWYFYALDRTLLRTPSGTVVTATWGDYDHVVVGNEAVLIKWPAYAFGVASGAPGQSQGVRVRLVQKSALIAGAPVNDWTDLQLRDPRDGSLWVAPVEPAIGSGKGVAFYLLGMRGCGVVVWAIQDRPIAPEPLTREVPAGGSCGGLPAGAPQPGTDPPIDIVTFGHNVVYRSGMLWYAHVAARDLGGGLVSTIRVLAVDVSRWPDAPTMVQDWIYGERGSWVLAPALMIDGSGNIVIVFCRTSPTEFASLYYTYRTPADAPGTLRPPRLLHAGDGSRTQFSPTTGSRNRFVDFFVAQLDPVDGTVWTFGAFVGAGGTRGTWVANVSLGPS
jgi:hypothetical protein